jgi:hypothetical protein
MRSTLRIMGLIVVMLALLLPLGAYASDGPCPDDPELSKDCYPEAPPFYVVINRSFEDLDRPGTGCQPIILEHPDCKACCEDEENCLPAMADLEDNVCPMLADRVDWEAQDGDVLVYQMCCDCATDPDGEWTYTVRILQEDGSCPIDEDQWCQEGLPPGTGIELPAPVIVAGLALLGAALLAAGMLVRRRTTAVA